MSGNMHTKGSTKILIVALVASSIANGILGYRISSTKNASDENLLLQERYPLLSKRILSINPNDIIVNFIPLREALKGYVSKQDGKVGAYFEYLPSGTSIGANDTNEVKLASLSKVPIAMSIFKKIERGQMSLGDTIILKEEYLDKKFGTLWKKGVGTRLTIDELIRFALIESDNTAYYTLFSQLTGEEVNEVYQNLDIPIKEEEEEGKSFPIVSPKNYSSIFRSLYLSSFLSKENSNYILDILTKTIFDDKIVAGVPKDIRVAHKIGVFTRKDTSKDVYIDCGIVYVPERPYTLCIFVLDTDDMAKKHMAYISKMIYGYIVRVKGG